MSNMDSYSSLFEGDDFETFGPTCHLCFKEYSSADALDFHMRNFCEYRQPLQEVAKAQPRQAQASNPEVEPSAKTFSESSNSQNQCPHCLKSSLSQNLRHIIKSRSTPPQRNLHITHLPELQSNIQYQDYVDNALSKSGMYTLS